MTVLTFYNAKEVNWIINDQCWHKVRSNSLLVSFNFSSYQWNIIAVYQFPPYYCVCKRVLHQPHNDFHRGKEYCKKPKYHLWSTLLISRIFSPPNYCDYRIIFCPLESVSFWLKWVAIFKDVDAKNTVILKAFNKVDLPDRPQFLDFQLRQPIGTNYTPTIIFSNLQHSRIILFSLSWITLFVVQKLLKILLGGQIGRLSKLRNCKWDSKLSNRLSNFFSVKSQHLFWFH